MICETDGDCVRDDYSKCAAITVEADELITTIFQCVPKENCGMQIDDGEVSGHIICSRDQGHRVGAALSAIWVLTLLYFTF